MSRSNEETHYNEKGQPRTKGIRNPIIVAMRGQKGGPMRDKRDRRSKDAKHSWKREWEG